MYVGKAGSSVGTRSLQLSPSSPAFSTLPTTLVPDEQESEQARRAGSVQQTDGLAREALKFFFSPDGLLIREMVLDETCTAIDSISRDAARELVFQLGLDGAQIPLPLRALAPRLSDDDRKTVEGIRRLSSFLVSGGAGAGSDELDMRVLLSSSLRPENRQKLQQVIPILREFTPSIRSFGRSVVRRLIDKSSSRVLDGVSKAVFG